MRPWALVTGASAGLGAALAAELARRGCNLLLVARRQPELEQVAEGLRSTSGVEAQVLPLDLTRRSAARDVEAFLEQRRLHISLLVNNAGCALQGPFVTCDEERMLGLVDLQLVALLTLTRSLLPGMLARGQGRILNVGSVYEGVAVPRQAIYAACKAFLHSFSEALAVELAGSCVSVTLLSPGVTRTDFRASAGLPDAPSRLALEPERVAREACEACFGGRRRVVPGRLNRLYVAAQRLLPEGFMTALTVRINARRGLDES